MRNKNKKYIQSSSGQKGFGIVEVLVSLSIFTMIVLSFNEIGRVALNSWEDAKNKSIAYNIIQGTFECIRNMRDNNFNTPGNNWDLSLDVTGVESSCTMKVDGFTRTISIENIKTTLSDSVVKKKITIDISWKGRMGVKNLKSATYLTEWRGKY